MELNDLIKSFRTEKELNASPRPYFNHSVSFKKKYTADERMETLKRAGLNVFFFPSEMITGCDFLSDSGTTTMTDEQWAALHLGDEAYGSNRGYFLLAERIRETFGKKYFNDPGENRPNAFIFHQGRSAEDALFSLLGETGQNLIIPSNGHFDTTEANIRANKIEAKNLFSPELKDENSSSLFKGNMDTIRLEKLLAESRERVPVVFLTITNNTGGGQPVALDNIRAVAAIAHKYGIPLMLDACRFAENAWFIKKYETGYENKSIEEIIQEIFSYADGFTISFKKDGLVNMGGGLFFQDNGEFLKKYPDLPNRLTDYQIMKEGHPTYGGLSGRDIMALVYGLKTVTREEYLDHRVGQVRDFGDAMAKAGIPVLSPAGGHAVYLDINRFFAGTAMKPGDFGGIGLSALLLALYGHRACELGYFAFGSYDENTGEEKWPEVNYVRFAVPRLRYEKQDLDAAVAAVKALYDNRDKIPAVNVVYGKNLTLRHFKARFEFR